MEKSLTEILRIQSEYYMSDQNLSQDPFFHNQISGSKDGFIATELLLNCNKIKKLTNSKEELIKALRSSTYLEVSKDGEKFKRNAELPKLSIQSKKREENISKPVSTKVKPEEIVIYTIKANEKTDLKWKEVQEELLSKNPALIISYLRFNTDLGHIGIAKRYQDELKITDLKIKSYKVTIEKAEKDELLDFWKEHGDHLKMCLNREDKKKEKDVKKSKKEEKEDFDAPAKKSNKKTNYKLKKPISLGSQKFIDIKDIRQKSRSIMNSIKEGEKALPHDEAFLLDVLKYHPNKEKSKDIDYFTIGRNPNFEDSQCFMIMKKDSTKVDFSVNKCLDIILETFGDK